MMNLRPLALPSLLLSASALLFFSPQLSAQTIETGHLDIVWGDKFGPNPESQTRFFLTGDDGAKTELSIAEDVEFVTPLLEMNRSRVSVTVDDTTEALRSNGNASLPVMSIAPMEAAGAMTREAAATGNQPWVTVMCKYAGNNSEPKDLNYFLNMYSSSYPGMDHYWREASYNRANVSGSTAHGWYTLPHPQSYYFPTGSSNLDLVAEHCLAQADADIFFPDYVGINLMFNDELDGFAWGGSKYITIDGQSRIYRITWEPPWGYSDITVIAHEMGHGFGMPHSSGFYGQTYDNAWDVMSDAWVNCSNANDAVFGCLGQQTISFHRELVGWFQSNEIFTFDGTSRIITLDQLTQPSGNNYLMAKIPIGGSATQYYTVEARNKVGYDQKLSGEGVIIHEVDRNRSNRRPAHVIDIDENGDTNDDGALFSVGETFTDPANNVCVTVRAKTSTGYSVTIGCDPVIDDPPGGGGGGKINTGTLLLLQ